MKKFLICILVLGCVALGFFRYFKINIKVGTNDSKIVGSSQFVDDHLNKPLPAFVLKDMEGNTIRSRDLRGKRVHLNLWSISCKPCIEEFDELNQLKKQYGPEYVFLALAREDSIRVNRVLQRRRLTYQVLPNASQYFTQVGVDAYPKNFFVDSQGIIRHVIEGSQLKLADNSLGLVKSNYETYHKILDLLK